MPRFVRPSITSTSFCAAAGAPRGHRTRRSNQGVGLNSSTDTRDALSKALAALAELSNAAMTRAANSLPRMVEHQVMLSVPSVDIVSKEAATQIIAKANNPKLVAVRQDFAGRGNSPDVVRAV